MACDTPFWVLPKGAVQSVPVPCGRCPPCKKRRVDGWVFRLLQEEKRSLCARFVTLTYAPHSVPVSPNGHLTLSRGVFVEQPDGTKKYKSGDLQLFFKRLRKALPGVDVRYYACGEYGGGIGARPHYHAIIFNAPDDAIFDAWKLDGKAIGKVDIGDVSGDSIAYTMKYIDKDAVVRGRRDDDRVHQFAVMSKGLGDNYVTPEIVDFHHDDYSRLYLVRDGGHKVAMPRFYKDRIYNADDGGHQRWLIQTAVDAKEADNYQQYTVKYGDNPNYTYAQYVESQRLARYKSFYSQQRKRDKL